MAGLEEELSRDLELTGAIEGPGGGVDGAEGSSRDERSYTSVSVTADWACSTACRRSSETKGGCGDAQTVSVVHKVERLTEYLESDSFADGKVA
jgi:hypothetical protein